MHGQRAAEKRSWDDRMADAGCRTGGFYLRHPALASACRANTLPGLELPAESSAAADEMPRSSGNDPRMTHLSRREFLAASLAGGVGLSPDAAALLSSRADQSAAHSHRWIGRCAWPGRFGIGNRGNDMIETFAATGLVSMVAFCDADLDGARHEGVPRPVPVLCPCSVTSARCSTRRVRIPRGGRGDAGSFSFPPCVCTRCDTASTCM